MLRPLAIFDRISQSLGKLYCLLERPRAAGYVVVTLLVVHTGLLAYSAYVHSPTLNEPGHLVAGLSHWKFGRFELYRVNPPLVRMVAALPVMAAGYREDWSSFYEKTGSRPVFSMGEDFVAANGERSFFLFMVARWACIPFSWLGAVVCYLWARDLYGRPAGVFACAIWCFSPNILAHASLITADVGGTALGVAACYTFWRWLKRPTWTQAALTGCVLGLAELAKTTLILFYPLWPLLWAAYRWPNRRNMRRHDWLREATMLLLRMAIGLYVLNLGYGFENSFKPIKTFQFTSSLFTGKTESRKIQELLPLPQEPESSDVLNNRFADTCLSNLPVPFPKNYLLGIDIQQRDFEDYGRPSYLRGQWKDHGWWYYYLYASMIKVPLGTLLLGFLSLIASLTFRQKYPNSRKCDILVLLLPAVVIFTVVSLKAGFSEHFRYVLPCFPFAFIWLGSITKRKRALRIATETFDSADERGTSHPSLGRHVVVVDKFALATTASLLLLWSVASSLWTYPHSLSYFNESIGGPLNGSKHLLGSSVDWGQDLRYFKWLRGRGIGFDTGHLAYFGYLNPDDVGIGIKSLELSVPDDIALNTLPPGRYAVSTNFTVGYPWFVVTTEGARRHFPQNALSAFSRFSPVIRAGYSISIYDIPHKERF